MKNTINDIRLGKCYNCLCRACSVRHCPWTYDKLLNSVCQKRCHKFDKKSKLKPVLSCDFFEHCQIKHVFKFKRTSLEFAESKNYFIVRNGSCFGFYTYREAVEKQRQYGGIIKQINICDFNREI